MGIILLIMALIVMLAGCGAPPDPAETRVPLQTISLLDSVGVELGDSSYVFGAIMGIEFLPGGGFAVLDRAAGNIRLYTGDGVHQRTVSRSGSAPGEIVQAYGLMVWSNGDLGVIDPFQGGLMRFSPEGEYLGLEFEVIRNVPLEPRLVGDSSYVAVRTEIHEYLDQVVVESFIGSFPLAWEPSLKYISEQTVWDPFNMGDFLLNTFFYRPWAVDQGRGTVYVAPYDQGRYSIMVFHPDGEGAGTLSTEIERVRKTPEEIAREKDYLAAFLTAAEAGEPMYDVNIEPFPYRHPVQSMEVDDEGNLWVLRGDLDGVFFNVWNSRGERVTDFEIPGLQGGDLRFRVRDHRMILYSENPEDYQKIYLASIPR